MGSQPIPAPSWKEEVNRRLAAHKSRKGPEVSDASTPPMEHAALNRRAAEAAARVAARYAKAPTYSEMQAAEARAALRAAEAATRAALEAQAVAQAALESLEQQLPPRKPALVAGQFTSSALESIATPEEEQEQAQPIGVLWDTELPKPPAPELHKSSVRASGQVKPANRAEVAYNHPPMPRGVDQDESVREVPAATPIPANLIEFPRELVATRRMRPRLTGARHDALSEMFGQLSIFEVDPGAVSTEPPIVETAPETEEHPWTGPEWSDIRLDDAPEEHKLALAAEPQGAEILYVAPLSLRLLANVVDVSLIVAIVTGCAAAAAHWLRHLPGIKATELGAVAALVTVAVLYYGLSFLLAEATPGMKFAGIALCTFDGDSPTAAQIRARYGALLLSLLPLGLGAAWAIFDDDHLCWHNRISRMYLRECIHGVPEEPAAGAPED